MKFNLLIWCLTFIISFVRCNDCVQYKHDLSLTDDRNCERLDKNLTYHIEQPRYGTINIEMPVLAACNHSSFKIRLYVDQSVASPVKCDHNYTNYMWRVHTSLKTESYSIYRECTNNQVPFIKFNYVFTGCYKIVTYKYNEDTRLEAEILHKSYPTFISTDYKMKPITEKGVITLQKDLLNEELEVRVIINSSDTIGPPDFSATLGEDETDIKDLEGVLKVGNCSDEACNNFEELFEINKSIPNVTFYCNCTIDYYNRIVYICKYKELKHGTYKFKYSILGDIRCGANTIWTKEIINTCEANTDINIPQKNPMKLGIYVQSTDDGKEYYYIIPIVAVLTLGILPSSIFIYRRIRKKRINLNIEFPQYINIGNINTDVDPPEILLIYTNACTEESSLFNDVILNFKKLLQQAGDVSILDKHDQNQRILEDPNGWIVEKITNPKIKVILFLNFSSIMIYNKMLCAPEKWQDNLFLFEIKQLQANTERNNNNSFVLHMNNFSTNYNVFNSLPTKDKYIMPNDIRGLFKKLFGHNRKLIQNDLKDFTNCCSKYNKELT